LGGSSARLSIAGKQAINGPTAAIYNSLSQSIASGASFTTLALNSEEFDVGSCFNNSSSTATLNGLSVPAYSFCPNVAGYYQINGYVSFATLASASGIAVISLFKNGAEFKRGSRQPCSTSGVGLTVNEVIYMNGTGDYVDIRVLQASGGTATTEAGQAIGSRASFTMVRGA
jgi:hypothetical protein